MRFINPGMLPPAVFAKCIRDSEPLMGSTGDASFVEALSEGKVVLYQLMRWKTELLHGFVDMVVQRMPDSRLSEFYKILLRHGEVAARDELVEFYMRNKEVLSQDAMDLAVIIKKECDISSAFSSEFRRVFPSIVRGVAAEQGSGGAAISEKPVTEGLEDVSLFIPAKPEDPVLAPPIAGSDEVKGDATEVDTMPIKGHKKR